MTTITNPQTADGPAIPIENCIANLDSVFEPDPHAGRIYTPNYRTLCSIFPEPLVHHMLHAGGRKEYKMPAVPKGSYALLRVYDTWTLTRDLSRAAGAESIDEWEDGTAMQRSPVHCQAVADDLIRMWAQDAPGNASGAKPGVMIIGGDTPTQLELDGLNDMQITYFRWLVMKADDYWITGKREYITDDHRRALRWLGSEERDWYKKINAVLLKRCPTCAEEINALATVCRYCATNLVKFYRENGIEPTYEQDPGVFQFIAQFKARQSVSEKKTHGVSEVVAEVVHEVVAGADSGDADARRAAILKAAALGREADLRAAANKGK